MAAATVARKKATAQKSNKKMFWLLGVVALVAVVRFALPTLAGGESSAPPPVIVQNRHLVKPGSLSKSSSGAVVAVSRPYRNPFSPAPGYASSFGG